MDVGNLRRSLLISQSLNHTCQSQRAKPSHPLHFIWQREKTTMYYYLEHVWRNFVLLLMRLFDSVSSSKTGVSEESSWDQKFQLWYHFYSMPQHNSWALTLTLNNQEKQPKDRELKIPGLLVSLRINTFKSAHPEWTRNRILTQMSHRWS